jgi:hypothetical protein
MKTVKIDKDQPRWNKGTWIGIIDHTNEHIIGTEEGVVKCRSIHPMERSKKWDVEAMKKIKGSPWKPNPNRKSLRITTRICQEDEDDSENEDDDPDKDPGDVGEEFEIKVDTNEDEEKQREAIRKAKEVEEFEDRHPRTFKMYIMKEDIFKYGITPNCGGCKYVMGERKNAEGHNKECKERIKELMKSDLDMPNALTKMKRNKQGRKKNKKTLQKQKEIRIYVINKIRKDKGRNQGSKKGMKHLQAAVVPTL